MGTATGGSPGAKGANGRGPPQWRDGIGGSAPHRASRDAPIHRPAVDRDVTRSTDPRCSDRVVESPTGIRAAPGRSYLTSPGGVPRDHCAARVQGSGPPLATRRTTGEGSAGGTTDWTPATWSPRDRSGYQCSPRTGTWSLLRPTSSTGSYAVSTGTTDRDGSLPDPPGGNPSRRTVRGGTPDNRRMNLIEPPAGVAGEASWRSQRSL